MLTLSGTSGGTAVELGRLEGFCGGTAVELARLEGFFGSGLICGEAQPELELFTRLKASDEPWVLRLPALLTRLMGCSGTVCAPPAPELGPWDLGLPALLKRLMGCSGTVCAPPAPTGTCSLEQCAFSSLSNCRAHSLILASICRIAISFWISISNIHPSIPTEKRITAGGAVSKMPASICAAAGTD